MKDEFRQTRQETLEQVRAAESGLVALSDLGQNISDVEARLERNILDMEARLRHDIHDIRARIELHSSGMEAQAVEEQCEREEACLRFSIARAAAMASPRRPPWRSRMARSRREARRARPRASRAMRVAAFSRRPRARARTSSRIRDVRRLMAERMVRAAQIRRSATLCAQCAPACALMSGLRRHALRWRRWRTKSLRGCPRRPFAAGS